jgi:hypothetical protein
LKIDSTAEIEINEANYKAKVCIKPNFDKKGIIETRTYIYPEGSSGKYATRKTRTWSLSGDKKLLTIKDHIETNSEQVFDMVLVYERQ